MISIEFNAIWIPIVISVLSFGIAIFYPDDSGGGFFSGLGNLLLLIPASLISMLAWMLYAIMK